jgi:hypothetical protein
VLATRHVAEVEADLAVVDLAEPTALHDRFISSPPLD